MLTVVGRGYVVATGDWLGCGVTMVVVMAVGVVWLPELPRTQHRVTIPLEKWSATVVAALCSHYRE
jgi:hypothetical protein